MQRGRRADRALLARLRAERPWAVPERAHIDAALVILRIAVGVTFVAHGVDKLTDLTAATLFFETLGIPAASLMAPLVSVTELVGGLLLLAGLATPLAGVALAGDMLVAYLTAHIGHGFFVSDGGGELVLLLGACALMLAVAGPGRFSVDRVLVSRTGTAARSQ